MKIFITGATGVIGRRIVPKLVAVGHDITAAFLTPAKRVSIERMSARALPLDLFDAPTVRTAVVGQDAIINLATHLAMGVRNFWAAEWRENDRIRREASANLVEAAIAGGATRFIQESFAPIYVSAGTRWIDEAAPVRPSHYNRTTLVAEHNAEEFAGNGRTAIVTRFGLFYGADAAQSRDMLAYARRRIALVPGPEDAYISSVTHADAAAAVVALLDAPPGIYNVVDDQPLTHRQFIDGLADAMHVEHLKLPPRWLMPLFGSPGEMLARSLRISNRKLRETTGWTPSYPSAREGWREIAREIQHSESHPRS